MKDYGRSVSLALEELAAKHPVMAELIACHGPYEPKPSPDVDVFASLSRAIIYQQLAGKAAASIYRRFEALFPAGVSAHGVLSADFDSLRGAGLSRSKATAILDLAEHIHDGRLDPVTLCDLKDDDLSASLVRVRGIGPWTAQMFMLFQLGRLNVWPSGDLGVRRGFGVAFRGGQTPTARELEGLGEPYEPYRSIVAWYCWRAADAAKVTTKP